ncbi:hypothetical protein H5410_060793 [Solanum commersonii]|uniref:Uncharacterized protein n=1 Tax=Solanum commersonii TaxID=4109 RepID=A0A9J5W601_SOLCO|nr:hypothetical protein H5410_060793 [Solanum commersonii]
MFLGSKVAKEIAADLTGAPGPFDTTQKKAAKKSHVKREKGPGPRVQKQSEEKEMSSEDRIAEMKRQKWSHLFEPPAPYLHEPEVREFNCKMELLEDRGVKTTIQDIEILLVVEILGIILGVSVKGVRSIEGCKPSSEFSTRATKCGDIKRTRQELKIVSISSTAKSIVRLFTI